MKSIFPCLLLACAALASKSVLAADAPASPLAGRSVLVIGDSQLVGMSAFLHDELQSRGATVHTLAVCGTFPSDWLSVKRGICDGAERIGNEPLRYVPSGMTTQPLPRLLADEHPDLLIVVLGDNIAGYGMPRLPEDWISHETAMLTRVVANSGVACIWVGPGWGEEGGRFGKTAARVRQLVAFMAPRVGPCLYVDSLALSAPGEWATKDGLHLRDDGYQRWSAAIAQKIDTLPIRLGADK
jgi:hypothetical protein